MRDLLAATALIAALAASASGMDRQEWGFVESTGEVQLFYGVPDSGSLTVAFICRAEQRHLEAVTTVLPRKPRTGQPHAITLSNGAVTATYGANVGHTESEGYYVGAPVAFAPMVLDVMRSGTTLTIGVPGGRERVPLRGIAAPLARFEAACFRRG